MPDTMLDTYKAQNFVREKNKNMKTFKSLNIDLHGTQWKKNIDTVQWKHRAGRLSTLLGC